ncbi:DUF6427 family protein [Lutimonas sp.]|uniref:DUF6427 family protein n=1 Tax=Lutimonas sp. TaxID=1872403 RepID=UPI003D9B2129
MIANFFNKTKPINFLVLAVLVFIIFLITLFKGTSEPLNFYFFVKTGLFLFLAIATVFVLNFIIRKNSLTEDNSLAILFYILLTSFFPNSFLSEGIFASNFILLFGFRRIYSLRSSLETKEKIFDGAFWIGIASLFYIGSLIYLILVYAAVIIFRKIEWRNFIIPLIGVLTPIFLSFTYLLAFDDLGRFYDLWTVDFDLGMGPYLSSSYLVPLLLMGILSAIAIYPTTKRSLLAKIDFKATWSLLITHIGISLILVFISPDKDGSELVFLFFPISVLFANYLQVINRYWIKELIIYLFIITFIYKLF